MLVSHSTYAVSGGGDGGGGGGGEHHFTATIEYDGNSWDSQTIPIGQASQSASITIQQINAAVLGNSTPTLTFNIEERAWGSLNGTGTPVWSTDQTADANGEEWTTFANSGIAAKAHLVFVTGSSASSGTVNAITITVYYTVD